MEGLKLIGKEAREGQILGMPGLTGRYIHTGGKDLPPNNVRRLEINLGKVEGDHQWTHLCAMKENGRRFTVSLLSSIFPPRTLSKAYESIKRYALDQEEFPAVEFWDQGTGGPVLPELGIWEYLMPDFSQDKARGPFPDKMNYLGHRYVLDRELEREYAPPTDSIVLNLDTGVMIGPAHNTRQKNEERRYDGSDYELMDLCEEDYRKMMDSGMNLLRVNQEQVEWIRNKGAFYWGLAADEISYPEELYRSNYLGPTIFMDEPAVRTRDGIIRPRLDQEEGLGHRLTVDTVLKEFQDYFAKQKESGAPTRLLEGLSSRPDVDIGRMDFKQVNLFSWETMISSALFQLFGQGEPPSAMVFEPPGQFGAMRTLPEFNMSYGCQLPVDDPKVLTDIIYSFLRGAARVTGSRWGMSIYGGIDAADSYWFQTHAYDLGASLFLFWDSHELACVPFGECLSLARNLSLHARNHPHRDLEALKARAEVALVIPSGYNLGHIDMGRGNLWGLAQLNLERRNQYGVKYRTVMRNLFTEIERYVRLGQSFDLFWDIPAAQISGYREVTRIKEDGGVNVDRDGSISCLNGPRKPTRPGGKGPSLTLDLQIEGDVPATISARAGIEESRAPVFYTPGRNLEGIYKNELVMWELFGPEEGYCFLNRKESVLQVSDGISVEIKFNLREAGNYRLRAATCDVSGRTSVVWKKFRLG